MDQSRILVLKNKGSRPADMLESIVYVTEQLHVESDIVTDMESAQAKMEDQHYSFVLMDMPSATDMDGLRDRFPDTKYVCWETLPSCDPYLPPVIPMVPREKFDYFCKSRDELYDIIKG